MTIETEVADLTVAAEDLAATVVNVRNALQGSATTVLSQQATITADIATVNAGIATINANLAAIGEMANKVDKVAGKGLSANDYTDAEKTKLAGLSEGGGGGGPTAWADITGKPAVIAAGATAADARTAIGAVALTDAVGKTGAQSMTGVLTAGGLLSNAGVIGYGPGAGGTATQETSKSAPVTLNKPCGQITMHPESMGTGAVGFTLHNSLLGGANGVIVTPTGPFTNYGVEVAYYPTATSVVLRVRNFDVPRSDALIINFMLIKGSKT